MAVLNNLIVHGSSKFLNDAYFNILAADTGRFNKLATKVLGNDGETITVHGLMDVQGELHTKSWSNSNIATIDGSFFICPTLKVTETGSTSNGLTITQSGNTWSIQITSSSAVVTNSVYTMNSSGTVTTTGTWTLGSKVAITGEILVNNEWLPLGTLRGIITARSSDLKSVTVSNITDGYSSSNNILNTIGAQSNVKHRNIKISLYEWTLSDSSTPTTATTNPIGIYMTALGDGTGQTMIDIYGGQEPSGTTYKGLAKPYVRIGNLSGLSNLSVGGQNPKGWGIYTSNGYFEGTIAARRGYIGNNTKYWTIGTSGTNSTIFSGPTTVSATGTAGTYLGTDGFLNTASASVYAQITNGILTAKGADITGVIKANTGYIGGSSGWTIASQQISSGSIGTDNSMFLSTKNLAGTVAGVTLTTTAPSWRLTVGSNFGVDNTGKLYATSANITGTIDATSFSAKSYSGSTLKRQMSLGADGLKLMDGSGTILSQIDGSASTIGKTSGDSYNINITGTAIDLRYNTDVLNRINSSGMTLYDGNGVLNSNIIAQFGTNSAQIGLSNGTHVNITSDGLYLYDNVNLVSYFTDNSFKVANMSSNGRVWSAYATGNINWDSDYTSFLLTHFKQTDVEGIVYYIPKTVSSLLTSGGSLNVDLLSLRNAGLLWESMVTRTYLGARVKYAWDSNGNQIEYPEGFTYSFTNTSSICRLTINYTNSSGSSALNTLTKLFLQIPSYQQYPCLMVGGYADTSDWKDASTSGGGIGNSQWAPYPFIVGNGITKQAYDEENNPNGFEYNPSNALTVDWNGNVEAAGEFITRQTTLNLGNYISAAILTSNAGDLFFSIPTGRVFPSGTTISKITFNIVARVSNANGIGYYIIKSASGGSDGAAFDSSVSKTFYNANNASKTVTSSMWSKTLDGRTNIRISIAGGNDFFSGTTTIRNYINNNAAVVYVYNIVVTLNIPSA